MSFKFNKSNLSFDVYTVASKPTAPGANNDIALITSVPMPNWIMSPDKPSGRPRSDGDVWIQYSVSGDTFNALKNNAMMIATIKAWQYVDGAWTDVEAVSCQNGEWVDWTMHLWKEGEGALSPFTTPVAHKYPSHSTNMVIGDTLSISNDYIGAYRWDVPIENFPRVNTIFAEVSNVKYHASDSGDWQLKMSISDRQDHGSVDKVNAKRYTVIPDSVANQIISLDIPEGMTGYFAIGGWGTITIHNVWTK